MRIALISPGSSIHTRRWANGLAGVGHEVFVLSAHTFQDGYSPKVEQILMPYQAPVGYLTNRRPLDRVLDRIKPDIVNTHSASGYGLLSRMIKYYPHLLSVWGSDVFEFPDRSPLHRRLLVTTLSRATGIASTSIAMKARVKALYPAAHVDVVPFGVDTERFCPPTEQHSSSGPVWIGTVKGLDPRYGIDTLIHAFHICRERIGPRADLRLRIIGGGPQEAELKSLVDSLALSGVTSFEGQVAHNEIPTILRKLDIFAALSREESFGVSILEAGACGLPVVVSEALGPREVTRNGETGLLCAIDDVEAAARALQRLVVYPAQRSAMGAAGRAFVCANYSWDRSLELMEEAYRRTIAAFSTSR